MKSKITTKEADWTTQAGFRAVVLFIRQSHRCGYVLLPKTHIAFGKKYNSIDVDVHGGLTFSEDHILDFIEKGENFWVVGFDCIQPGDASADEKFRSLYEGHLWTLKETAEECEKLARQLKSL